MEYALLKFELELEKELSAASGSIESQRKRMDELDIELARLAEAVATEEPTSALLKAISVRESERRSIEQFLWGSGPGLIKEAINDARETATKRLTEIREVIQGQARAAIGFLTSISQRALVDSEGCGGHPALP